MTDLPVTTRLDELEAVIEAGLPHFFAVGRALTEIRDSKLYLERHTTFDTYVQDRWQFSRQYAYSAIGAAAVEANVNYVVDTPILAEHARILSKLTPDEQRALAPQIVNLPVSEARAVVAAAHPPKRRPKPVVVVEPKNVTPAEPAFQSVVPVDALPETPYMFTGRRFQSVPSDEPFGQVGLGMTLWDMIDVFVRTQPADVVAEATGDLTAAAGRLRKAGRVIMAAADMLPVTGEPSQPAQPRPAFRPSLPDDDGVSFGFSRPAPKSAEKPAAKSRFGR